MVALDHHGVILCESDLELNVEVVHELRAAELLSQLEREPLPVWLDSLKNTAMCQ